MGESRGGVLGWEGRRGFEKAGHRARLPLGTAPSEGAGRRAEFSSGSAHSGAPGERGVKFTVGPAPLSAWGRGGLAPGRPCPGTARPQRAFVGPSRRCPARSLRSRATRGPGARVRCGGFPSPSQSPEAHRKRASAEPGRAGKRLQPALGLAGAGPNRGATGGSGVRSPAAGLGRMDAGTPPL